MSSRCPEGGMSCQFHQKSNYVFSFCLKFYSLLSHSSQHFSFSVSDNYFITNYYIRRTKSCTLLEHLYLTALITVHVNFIFSVLVKEQSSFSWDWGPSFPTMGLWKGVQLEAFDVLKLVHISSVPLFSTPQHF